MTNKKTYQPEELLEIEQRLGTYINPLSDFGFKKLFGEEGKEFLISFLNAILKHLNVAKIKDLTYRNTEMLGALEIDRKVVYDLYCITEEGSNFVVELQKAEQSYYKNRSLAYGCRAVSDQTKKGRDYKYDINKVFVVSILNFVMPENKGVEEADYMDSGIIRSNKYPHKVMIEELNFVFLELPNFNKTITIESDDVDKWMYIFKNLSQFNDKNGNENSAYIDAFWTKFFHQAKIKNLQTEELEQYQSSLTLFQEMQNVKDTAYKNLELEKQQITLEKEQITLEKEQITLEKEQITLEKEQITLEKEQITLEKEQIAKQLEKTEKEANVLSQQLKKSEVDGIKRLLKFKVSIINIMKEYPNFTESEILNLK